MPGNEVAIVQVPLVLFLATIIRSTFGFGEALVAVPLLALVIPVEVAVPVAVLASVTVAGIVVLQDWRKVHVRSARSLVVSTLFGIPLGLTVLKFVPEPVVKLILAAVIIGFSIYFLAHRTRCRLEDDRFAWVFGFSAGVLGGAYGMNGPPLVLYGAMRGWTPGHFRATLQGYFLPASLLGIAGYWMAGMWTPAVSRFYAVSLLPVLLATFAGRILNRRMHAGRFLIYVHLGLIAIGITLASQALFR